MERKAIQITELKYGDEFIDVDYPNGGSYIFVAVNPVNHNQILVIRKSDREATNFYFKDLVYKVN